MLRKIVLLAAILAVSLRTTIASKSYLYGVETLSLNAERAANVWTAYGVNATGKEIRVPAAVPGGIYSDLDAQGIFKNDIYHEYNDVENKWVGHTNWTFSRKFTVTNALLEKAEVVLVCEGLDTISEVFVNDVSVGKSENMFVRYIFDVKDALKVGENTIRVAFQSPVEYAEKEYYRHIDEQGYDVVPFNIPTAYRGENKAQMIRKVQASFSWDWGPSYPSSGIWKNIYIEGYSGAIIRDVLVFTTPTPEIPDETSATQWKVTARVYYDSATNQQGIFSAQRVDTSIGAQVTTSLEKGKGKSVDVTFTETGDNIKLWWPNGYGEQNLYWYNVSLSANNGDEYSSRQFRKGFRTVELNEDFVYPRNETKGREFYFIVNGLKMYSKGSNSIPLHVLPERITERQTEWLLRAAKMSHQNMIRVWGGGMYETEEFFDWADEYGIFIWEDFMFACAMYPATDEFRDNVRKEVDTQIKRLQYRTSLVMWAGNNENELFLMWDFLGTSKNHTLYYNDYVTLYVDTIKVLTEQMDPSRKYLASSPTNGIESERSGWTHENPNHWNFGDVHFYDYRSDNWDYRMFYRARYASEYGYQSFPHYETLAERADDITTWSWESSQMDHRQHHPGGQEEIRDMVRSHLPFPANYNSSEAFPYMLYMAQITQIMGQKTQTESYRRLQDKYFDDGNGHNMGALYWQLNDIWEGCSWASVEINGRHKLQLYYARKFFSPVLPSIYRDDSKDVVVELVSDLPHQQVTGALRVQVFKLTSLTPVFDEEVTASTEFLRAPEVFRIENSVLETIGCADDADSGIEDVCVVYVTFPGHPDNFHFLQYPKNKRSLKDPQLKIEDVQGSADGHEISFKLTTEAVAPFVFLTAKEDHRGYFSDNGFLQTGEKQMTYYSADGITPQQFLNQIDVMSLFDVTKVAE